MAYMKRLAHDPFEISHFLRIEPGVSAWSGRDAKRISGEKSNACVKQELGLCGTSVIGHPMFKLSL